ncbi:MAG: serine/threonine protein kinase [Acidobacteria bacterium]|nr:serine/threonine protein kinase [Acidobacteriota bacterium]
MIGQTIAHYRILDKLGEGGIGIVYLAEDTRLGRNVALKVLAPHATHNQQLRLTLQQEARAAAALSHPGIATIYSVEEAGGQWFVVYEYVKGETLRAEIERGALAPLPLLRTAVDLASALSQPHAMGIVHRDLKPENIIRRPDGSIKVLDFGLASFHNPAAGSDGSGGSGAIAGTVAYMSPEQVEGRAVDFRSDLFSFGVLVYELATGIHPFEGATPASTSVRILTSDPLPLRQQNPMVPAVLDQVVRKCLRKNPAERYQSTVDLLEDLQPQRTETVTDARQVSSGGEVPGRRLSTQAWTPQWWWQFHQLCIVALYAVSGYTAWRMKAFMPWGLFVFFGLLLCSAVAAVLRGHLWFAAMFYPDLLARQRWQSRHWIRFLDRILAIALLAVAAATALSHASVAVLLVLLGVGIFLASVLIEPATASAAFGSHAASSERKL